VIFFFIYIYVIECSLGLEVKTLDAEVIFFVTVLLVVVGESVTHMLLANRKLKWRPVDFNLASAKVVELSNKSLWFIRSQK
jgi:hypothetical protein